MKNIKLLTVLIVVYGLLVGALEWYAIRRDMQRGTFLLFLFQLVLNLFFIGRIALCKNKESCSR